MRTIPTFGQTIEQLAPVIDQQEELRKSLLRKAQKKSLLYDTIIIGLATGIALAAPDVSIYVALFGFIAVVIATIATFSYYSGILSPRYKKELIGKLVEGLVDSGKYEPEKGISENSFNQTKLFSRPDRYHTEDLISGRIDKTPFCFAEVHAEEKQTTTNSKGQTRTTWVTLFKGFMFVADFNKDFSAQTVIQRNSFLKLFRGNRVKLENTAFEKHFDVFSDDQVEARYLLTPSMMERMIALDEQFGNDLLVSFYQSQIVILIKSSRNHFECSLWKSFDGGKRLQEEYDTITSLTSIIEALDLNTRIWSKE